MLPSLPWSLGWIGLAVPPLVFGATATYLLYRTVATDGGRTRRLERRVDELEAELERLQDGERDARELTEAGGERDARDATGGTTRVWGGDVDRTSTESPKG